MSKVIIEQDHLLLKGSFEGIEVQGITSPVVLEADKLMEYGSDEAVPELTIGESWSEVSLDAESVEIFVVEGFRAPGGEEFFTLRADAIQITGVESGEPRTYIAQNVAIHLSGVVTRHTAESGESGETGTDKSLTQPTEPNGTDETGLAKDKPGTATLPEQGQESGTVTLPEQGQEPDPVPGPSHTLQIILGLALAVAAITAVLAIWQRRREAAMRDKIALLPEPAPKAEQSAHADRAAATQPAAGTQTNLMIGKLHHIGKRASQQDSLGLVNVPGGILAVIADGMGGLSDGDKVSQKIVYTMLHDGANRPAPALSGNLLQLVSHANAEVNHMLGGTGQYVSGSTLVAVLAEPNRFQWASVGDSRLYLYRGGGLLQINREHVYEAELLERAVNREMSFQEARSHAKKKSVTSFIGMGDLKHIDGSLQPVKTQRGDKLLLTTDGLFNTLSDDEIAAVLAAEPDPVKAASALESAVLAKNNPHQDNFSSILICYQ